MLLLALLATIYAATLGTSSALVDARRKPTVGVDSAGYDDVRVSYLGPCYPDGCIPENTRDRNNLTRWACKGDILDINHGCWVEYSFDEPQDLVEMRIAFYEGTENTRTLNVYTDDKFHSPIMSSGETNWYQTFDLHTKETFKLRLHLNDYQRDSSLWLSITEVGLMVD